ncbi:MAG: response regulator transcription factor [Candidatus Eremiobacteraeota bacterium]|nr:response regulator transcription factor [Candidatus Eremiobacteraeota bacterium]
MRALVVDDEPVVRKELVYTLARVAPGCKIEEAESTVEALALLQSNTFDVVFLDIHMPGLDGLNAAAVIKRLPKRPGIVFVTAFPDYALSAFNVAASDYLLKPVSEERLTDTLRRLRSEPGAQKAAEHAELARLPVVDNGRTLLLHVEDIRFIEARDHLVTVRLFDRAYRFRGPLGECAARLDRHGFLRVHRAYIVNPRHVVEVNPFLAGTYVLRVDDRTRSEVPVSRTFAAAVRSAFDL